MGTILVDYTRQGKITVDSGTFKATIASIMQFQDIADVVWAMDHLPGIKYELQFTDTMRRVYHQDLVRLGYIQMIPRRAS